jgi:hypothetical protein
MKLHKPPKFNALYAVSALLAGAFPAHAMAAKAIMADPINASFPAACGGGPVQTGLCLLGSTSPMAGGSFFAAPVIPGNLKPTIGYPVTLNVSTPLAAGSYVLYRDTDIDTQHKRAITVSAGSVTTLKTATIQWSATASSNLAVNLTAAPGSINYQGSSTLTWSSPGAVSCMAGTGYGWSGAVPLAGSLAVTLTENTTYTLSCAGKDGVSVSKSVTVKVNPNVTACLFNWAERAYPGVFASAGGKLLNSGVYNYRYYAGSNAYLGVSVVDNYFYFMGPDGVLQNKGPLSYWLSLSGCAPVALPSPRRIAGRNPIKLQHFQAENGINGKGCEAEVGNEGAQAYLPGIYSVSTAPPSQVSQNTPSCARGDAVSFIVTGGEAVALHSGNLTPQTLNPANAYQHPTKALSLTNIDHLRHDVRKLGFLSNWNSFNGVHNPASTVLDALVLSGAPNFHFVVPVKMSSTAACGLSLPGGGLPPRNLMTNCVFDGNGNLTKFQVNAGQYFSFDNIHAKSAVAGHVINSPFVVSGVKFNLKGN